MRGAILTPSGAAYQVHDECLQARINPTWANDDDCGELGRGSQEFGVAGHDQHTVWHESHNGLSDCEYRVELFRAFTTARSNPHVRAHLALVIFYGKRQSFLWPLRCVLVLDIARRAVKIERLNL